MKTGSIGKVGVPVALVLVGLAGCRSGGDRMWAEQDRPRLPFVGTQKDYWCVVAPDQIRVTSELTLQTRTARAAPLPIRLPYAQAHLETATFNGRELAFQKTGDDSYDIILPADRLFERQRQITFQWRLPLSELRYESGLYWTSPKGLIPVVFYELRAGVEPQSGFEVFGARSEERPLVRRYDGEDPRSEFGSWCALPVRRRQ